MAFWAAPSGRPRTVRQASGLAVLGHREVAARLSMNFTVPPLQPAPR
jgi:hypothetical protein